MSDGVPREQFFCIDHAPAEMRDALPKTPGDEVALLRGKLALLDQRPMPPEMKAKARADLEQAIIEIESGRRRLSDLFVDRI
jgi:hypothetical protein